MKKAVLRRVLMLLLMLISVMPLAGVNAESTATPTAPSSPTTPKRVTFTGYDDLQIIGSMYVPAVTPAPTLLLLHEAEGNKEVWAPFARKLSEAGYTVVAIDARHHGETGGYGGWADVLKDMPLVLEQLKAMPEVNPDAIGLIGASIGGGVAYFICAAEESCQTAVLLSPAPLGFSPELVKKFGERSVMVFAGANDGNFAANAKQFEDDPVGKAQVTIISGTSDHGTQLLYSLPQIEKQIDEWLAEELPVNDNQTELESTAEATLEATAEVTSSP